MIVADASALASLARANVLELAGDEFGLHTTRSAVEAMTERSAFHGPSGEGARAALDHRGSLVVHGSARTGVETSRIDAALGDCAALAAKRAVDLLLTDDLLALPELERLVSCTVAPTPVLLSALVRRGLLAPADARFRLEDLVVSPRWLAGPVGRRAVASFEEATG